MSGPRRAVITAVMALLLLVPAGAVLAQPGNGGQPDSQDDDEAEQGNQSETGNGSSEDRGPPEDAGASADDDRDRSSAGFTVNGTSVTGRYVSFSFGDGTISGYTVTGTTWLAMVTWDPVLGDAETEAKGTAFEVDGDGGEGEARDARTGRLDAGSDAGVVVVTLADGITATELDEDEVRLDGPDGTTAFVDIEDGYVLDGDTLRSEQIRFSTDAGPSDRGAGYDDEDRRGPPEDRGRDRGDDRRAFRSGFTTSDGTIQGKHVSFTLDEGTLKAYTVTNRTWFTDVSFDPILVAEDIEAKGATFEIEGEDVEVKAIDNPTGHLRAEADDGTITLSLADGVTASMVTDDDRILLKGPDGAKAFLHGEDGIHLADGNTTVVAPEKIRFVAAASGIHTQEVEDAIADGRVVAQVMVSRGGDGTPEAVGIENGRVNLTTEASEGRVLMTIEGHGDGRAVVFNLEKGSVGPIEDLVIRFDGERIEPASGLDDVLTATEGEGAEYLLIVGANSTQVLVQVPHFSVHTVEVRSMSAIGPIVEQVAGSSVAFAVAIVAGAGFVGATYVMRSRKR